MHNDNLRLQLKEMFGYSIYHRGLSYFERGKVEKIQISNSRDNILQINGVVKGTRRYNSSIAFDIDALCFVVSSCNCPYYSGCKHSVALGLLFIDIIEEYIEENPEFNDLPSDGDESLRFMQWYDGGQGMTTERTNADSILEKLLSIGIDTDNLPDYILEELKSNLKKPEEKKIRKKAKVKKIKEDVFDIKNYYIVLENNSTWRTAYLYSRKQNYFSHSINTASSILNRYKNELSKEEIKLFNIISNNGYSAASSGRFYELIHETGIELYENKYSPNNKIKFDLNPPKIKAQLIFKEGYNEYLNCEQNSFVFSLDQKYLNKSSFILSGKYYIEITSKQINFHPRLPDELISLISRIRLNEKEGNYYPGKILVTLLTETEILTINSIIKIAKEHLDFETNMGDDFEIIESKKCEPKIIVDYNSSQNRLKMFPALDYGFEKVDVSETIFYSKTKVKPGLRRRDFYKFWGLYIISVRENKMRYALINEKEEINLFRKIHESDGYYGFTKTGKCLLKSKTKINDFFNLYLPRIKELGYEIEYIDEKIDYEISDFKADLKIDLNAENNWLYFDADCYCGEEKINISDLIRLVKKDEDFLRLEDGRVMRISNRKELEKFIFMLQSFEEREEGGYQGRMYHAGEMQNIISSSEYYNSRIADSFKNFIKVLEKGRLVKKVKLPEKMAKTMRHYQKDGVDWFYFLRKYGFAGVLADDMGLGKTLQTLAVLEKEKIKHKPSIVLCPKSLIYNWQNEVEKFTPKLKTAVIDGFPEAREAIIKNYKKYDLFITSYFTFRNDSENYDNHEIKFNYLVLDEAQNIKNHKTKIAQTVKKIDADFRLALTGTPLENNVSEIWSIYDFLMPGFLGTEKQFKQKFQNPIMKENNAESLNLLRSKIKPFMLRRLKQEVLKELPPKQEQISYCLLGDEQRILYQEILAKVKSEISSIVKEKGFSKSQIHILAALTKLRQVCNHPILLLKDKNYKKYESAKLDLCLDLTDEIVSSGRKVLIFSQFTKMLDILAKELKRKKYKYSYLSGKTNKRQELVDEFNSSQQINVFLISLKAGGTGLNLTSADNVIIFDPWWNPSVENQAIDRTHRIGQKKSVSVYRLITKGTIEEKIVELQNRKKLLFDNMVEASGETFKKLTWDDIRGLLE